MAAEEDTNAVRYGPGLGSVVILLCLCFFLYISFSFSADCSMFYLLYSMIDTFRDGCKT